MKSADQPRKSALGTEKSRPSPRAYRTECRILRPNQIFFSISFIIAEDSFRFLRSSYICANGKSRKAKVYISITFSREKYDTLEAVRDGMPSNGKSGASALRGGGNECEKQDTGD